jgi:hypothetical protein
MNLFAFTGPSKINVTFCERNINIHSTVEALFSKYQCYSPFTIHHISSKIFYSSQQPQVHIAAIFIYYKSQD